MFRRWSGLLALVFVAGSWAALPVQAAGPTPEQTIQAIEAKRDAAEAWIQNRRQQYEDFLDTNPTPGAAAAERDAALAEIAAKAAEAEEDITGKMEQHPNNPDVQQAGEDAIADVWATANSESDDVIAAYNIYVATATTTTTAAPTTTTTQPTTTTTQKTPTTTSTEPGKTPTTVPKTTTTTTTDADQSPTTTTPSSEDEGATPVSIGSSGPTSPGLTAAGNLQPDQRIASGSLAAVDPFNIGPVLDLLRLELPSVLSEPLVDLLVVLTAIAAAFESGIRTVGLPSALLIAGFLSVQGYQALRRRSQGPVPAALSG